MSLYDTFSTDKSAEVSGVWIDYGPGNGRFLIARAGGANVAYRNAISGIIKAHRHQIQADTLSEEVADKKQMGAFVDHVLKQWEGVPDRGGQELPYNRDNAIRLFNDLPDLYADLTGQAARISNFRTKAIEVDAGN